MKAMLRRSVATVVGSVTLLFASAAFAEGEGCYDDTDCANPACGGDVCNWGKQGTKPPITPDAKKVFYCQPAGQPGIAKGSDGWCTTDDNCKCKASGATCNKSVSHCTDTGTPGASGGSPAGGASGTAGAASGGGGAASTAGTASTAGAASKPPAKDDGGGCTLTVPGTSNSNLVVALGALGLGLAFARRRRA
jgi:hypothetical protein